MLILTLFSYIRKLKTSSFIWLYKTTMQCLFKEVYYSSCFLYRNDAFFFIFSKNDLTLPAKIDPPTSKFSDPRQHILL